jgi:hypothetical protein
MNSRRLIVESRPLTVLQLCFSSSGGLVSSVGGSASAALGFAQSGFLVSLSLFLLAPSTCRRRSLGSISHLARSC